MTTSLLRHIQVWATIIAAGFGVIALGDLFALQAGTLAGSSADAALWSWSYLHVAPSLVNEGFIVIGLGLALAPFISVISVRRSAHAHQARDHARLDFWRRLTWGAGIIETSGCLILVMSGILFFFPAAAALLIAGVAELASILYDVEKQPDFARHSASPQRTHLNKL